MASIIGTPVFFPLGDATTPGAQSVTVPSDATHVAILFHMSNNGGTAATLTSLTSTFAGTFTITQAAGTATAIGGASGTALVTSTGAKTFTPVFSATNTIAGAGCWVVYLKDVGAAWPTDIGFGQATGDGTTAGTASNDGLASGLALAMDSRLSPTSGAYPANQSGWTAGNTGQSGPGGLYAYYGCSRLRTLDLSSTGTVTATTQDTSASVIVLLTVEGIHATTGALTGQLGAVAGTAAHKTLHATSGALSGQGSSVVGSALNFTVHGTSGVLAGPGTVIAGTADHSVPAHDTSGALAGQGSSVVGSATRFRAHATSGTLAGAGSALAGTALRFRVFSTAGELAGQGAVIDGTAVHTTAGTFETSGALVGQGAAIAGSTLRYRSHATTGEITGPGAIISGAANLAIEHATSGNLVGPGAVVVGVAYGPEILKVGGDDAYHHTGWNKKAWKSKQKQEQALEETIRKTYLKVQGVEPTPAEVAEVVEEVKECAPEVIKPERFDYSGVTEWLQAQEARVAAIIAHQQEEDDEEALLLLL